MKTVVQDCFVRRNNVFCGRATLQMQSIKVPNEFHAVLHCVRSSLRYEPVALCVGEAGVERTV